MFNVGDRVRVISYSPGTPPDEFLNLYEPPLTVNEAIEVTSDALVGLSGTIFDTFVPGSGDEATIEDTNIPAGVTAYLVVFDDLVPELKDHGASKLKERCQFEQFELFAANELEAA